MRLRKLLAGALVPMALALGMFGFTAAPASAEPMVCSILQRNYASYAGSAEAWFARYDETHRDEDCWMGEYFLGLARTTERSIIEHCV